MAGSRLPSQYRYVPAGAPALSANPLLSLPRRQGKPRLLLDFLGPRTYEPALYWGQPEAPTKPFPRPRLVGTRQHAHGGPHHAAGGPSRRNLAHEGVSRPWEAWAHLLGELQTPPTPARSLARLWLPSQPHFAGTAPPAQAQDSAGRTTPARQVWGRGRVAASARSSARTAGRTACRGAGGRAGPGRAADGEFYGRAQSGGRRWMQARDPGFTQARTRCRYWRQMAPGHAEQPRTRGCEGALHRPAAEPFQKGESCGARSGQKGSPADRAALHTYADFSCVLICYLKCKGEGERH